MTLVETKNRVQAEQDKLEAELRGSSLQCCTCNHFKLKKMLSKQLQNLNKKTIKIRLLEK